MNVDHLRGQRYHPPVPPEEWARRARAVIDNRSAVRGFMEELGDPVGNVQRVVPDAWRIFGEATITAAAVPMPRGGCRWCYARSLATVHRLPRPVDTPAVRLLLGAPCDRCLRASRPRLVTGLTAAAVAHSYRPGVYEVTGTRGGRVSSLGRSAPTDRAGSPPDDGKHYAHVFPGGTMTLIHPAGCTTGGCPLAGEVETAARSGRPGGGGREVSLAFTASALPNLAARVRGGPPTPVRRLAAGARNVEAMRRMGVNPESYFGANFTTQEQDAALGALIRRTYPGRRKR